MDARLPRRIIPPAAGGGPPSLSIIIEWENADRIGDARARRMLAALHSQLGEADADPSRWELIFLHRADTMSEAAISAVVAEAAPIGQWPAAIRFVASPTGGYYEQKNLGAGLARNDTIMFLDSDVIPQPGWLAAMLEALADPAVEVVCGNTFIDHGGLYASAVALVWFFPTDDGKRDLVPSRRFFANNVAFRRSVFERHRFPDSGQFRGQCVFLAEELMRSGHGIWRNRAAIVSHPAPDGLRHFVVRALMHGHDDAIWKRASGRATARIGGRQFRDDMRRSLRNIRKKRGRVGLGPIAALGARAMALLYYGLKYSSYLLALVFPASVNRALRRADA